MGRAAGETGTNKVGAYEAAAGLWARVFQRGYCDPGRDRYGCADTLWPLASMGRALCTLGQWVAEVTVADGGVYIDVADNWEVSGDGLPSTWEYTLTFDRPSQSRTAGTPGRSCGTRPVAGVCAACGRTEHGRHNQPVSIQGCRMK